MPTLRRVEPLAGLATREMRGVVICAINEIVHIPSVGDNHCRIVRDYFSSATANVLELLMQEVVYKTSLSSWEAVWAIVLLLRTDVSTLRLRCPSNDSASRALFHAIGCLGWGLRTVDLTKAPWLDTHDLPIVETLNHVRTFAVRVKVVDPLLKAIGTHCENIATLIVHGKSSCTRAGINSLCSNSVCKSLKVLEIDAPCDLNQQDLHYLLYSIKKIMSVNVRTDIDFDRAPLFMHPNNATQPYRKLRFVNMNGPSPSALEQLSLYCPDLAKLSVHNPCREALVSLAKCKCLKTLHVCHFDVEDFQYFLNSFQGLIDDVELLNGSDSVLDLRNLAKFSSTLRSFQAVNVKCTVNGPLVLPALKVFCKRGPLTELDDVNWFKKLICGAVNLETVVLDCRNTAVTNAFDIKPGHQVKFLFLVNALNFNKNNVIQILENFPCLKKLGYYRDWMMTPDEIFDLQNQMKVKNMDIEFLF